MRELVLGPAFACGLLLLAACGSPHGGPAGGGGGGLATGGGRATGGGVATGGGAATDAGTCTHLCGSQCLPLNSIQGCGQSCIVCPVRAHASPTCDGVSCGQQCDPGFEMTPDGQCFRAWVSKPSAGGPTARKGAAMAYDARRQRVVMFGGSIGGAWFDETWEWDGSSWTLKSPASRPPARQYAYLVYDPDRAKAVLFGGNLYDDTWEWDGTSWVNLSIAGPGGRSEAAVAYEPTTKRVVVFGGFDDGCPGGVCGGVLSDMWALQWDAGVASWRTVRQSSTPGECLAPRMVFHETLGRLVLACHGGTWAWNGYGWDNLGSGEPTAVFFYDPHLGAPISTGYWNLDEAFEWADGGWTSERLARAPNWRQYAATAYDLQRSALVLFGGYDGHAELADTWELPTLGR